MGDVRTTVKSQAPDGMLAKLREIEDLIADLIATKREDLKTEGTGAAAYNAKAVERLREAFTAVQQARAALVAY